MRFRFQVIILEFSLHTMKQKNKELGIKLYVSSQQQLCVAYQQS
jgi:hypothetical protein